MLLLLTIVVSGCGRDEIDRSVGSVDEPSAISFWERITSPIDVDESGVATAAMSIEIRNTRTSDVVVEEIDFEVSPSGAALVTALGLSDCKAPGCTGAGYSNEDVALARQSVDSGLPFLLPRVPGSGVRMLVITVEPSADGVDVLQAGRCIYLQEAAFRLRDGTVSRSRFDGSWFAAVRLLRDGKTAVCD